MPLHKRMSGFRERKPRETINLIKEYSKAKGITRVTDITQLDYFGVPVFASIRPNAQEGSLCVNAGKGLSLLDAEVGAYMEAIEFHFAEFQNSKLRVEFKFPFDLNPNFHNDEYVLDFCPSFGREIDLTKKIGCIEAIDVFTGLKSFVPAELVFVACPERISLCQYFGSSSNGLASGNTVDEATLHGLIELIERDIRSFQCIKDESVLLNPRTLPHSIKKIHNKVKEMGYFLSIRYMPNIFQLPYFMAALGNVNDRNPIYISGGFGCHLSKSIALNRAVTECFQSRLSFIHGGRDDLEERYKKFENWTESRRKEYADVLISKLTKQTNGDISFQKIADESRGIDSISEALKRVKKILTINNLSQVLRIIYTRDYDPVQVVRVIVPKLEFFNETTTRIGVRLRDYATEVFK
jgi:ribosomal protein S12 methylthiotransferase accessory factor